MIFEPYHLLASTIKQKNARVEVKNTLRKIKHRTIYMKTRNSDFWENVLHFKHTLWDGVKLFEKSYTCKSNDKSYKLFSKNFSSFHEDLSQLFLFINFHIMAIIPDSFFPCNRANAIPPLLIKVKKKTENVSTHLHCAVL